MLDQGSSPVGIFDALEHRGNGSVLLRWPWSSPPGWRSPQTAASESAGALSPDGWTAADDGDVARTDPLFEAAFAKVLAGSHHC